MIRAACHDGDDHWRLKDNYPGSINGIPAIQPSHLQKSSLEFAKSSIGCAVPDHFEMVHHPHESSGPPVQTSLVTLVP